MQFLHTLLILFFSHGSFFRRFPFHWWVLVEAYKQLVQIYKYTENVNVHIYQK